MRKAIALTTLALLLVAGVGILLVPVLGLLLYRRQRAYRRSSVGQRSRRNETR
mgnify:CR=1 FL=1